MCKAISCTAELVAWETQTHIVDVVYVKSVLQMESTAGLAIMGMCTVALIVCDNC